MLGKVSSIGDELVPVTIAGPTDGSTNIVRRDLNQDYQLPLAIDNQYGAGYLGLTSLNKVLYNPVTGVLTVNCMDGVSTHVDIQETVECSIDRQILIQHIDEDGNLTTQPECSNATINTRCQVGIDGDGNPVYQTVLKVESICAEHYCGLSGVNFEEADENTPSGSVLFYDGNSDDGNVTLYCSDAFRYDPVSNTLGVSNGLVVDDGFAQTTLRDGTFGINAGDVIFAANCMGVSAGFCDSSTYASLIDGVVTAVAQDSSLFMNNDGIETKVGNNARLYQTSECLHYCVQDETSSSSLCITPTIVDICTNTVHLNSSELCVANIQVAEEVEFPDNQVPFLTWNSDNEKVYQIDGLYYDATTCTLNVCHVQSDVSLCQGTDDNYNCLNLTNALVLCHHQTDCRLGTLTYSDCCWLMTSCVWGGDYWCTACVDVNPRSIGASNRYGGVCIGCSGIRATWSADTCDTYTCSGSVTLGTCPLRNNDNQPVEAYTYVSDFCRCVNRWACFRVSPTGLFYRNEIGSSSGYMISLGCWLGNVECRRGYPAIEVSYSQSSASLRLNENDQFEWYQCRCNPATSYCEWMPMYTIPTPVCETTVTTLAALKALTAGQTYFIRFGATFNLDSGGSITCGATAQWYKPSSGNNKMVVCASNGYGVVMVDWNGSTFTRQSSVPANGTLYGTASSSLINVCGATPAVM